MSRCTCKVYIDENDQVVESLTICSGEAHGKPFCDFCASTCQRRLAEPEHTVVLEALGDRIGLRCACSWAELLPVLPSVDAVIEARRKHIEVVLALLGKEPRA